MCIRDRGDGVVDYVDATTIRILYDRTEDEEFVSFEPALKEYRICLLYTSAGNG